MKITLPSPCKVNLLLNILGREANGYHALETLLQPVPIFDELSIEATGSGIELTCNHPELPVDRGNLVFRAAELFLGSLNKPAGARIRLEKLIPLAAGLGGGSANAAITLRGLNEVFGSPLEPSVLDGQARQLGSDVPFFLQNQPALGTHYGEIITPLPNFPCLRDTSILLIHPGFGVSTAWAYQTLAKHPQSLNGRPGQANEMIQALNTGSLAQAAPHFYNSLEAPVLPKYPLLTLFQRFLLKNGAAIAMMSGSGSTTFALFENSTTAETAHEAFKSHFGSFAWTKLVKLHSSS